MYLNRTIGAVILMAGIGSRLGGEIPKQFLLLRDKKVYLHTLSVFDSVGIFDEIVLVCHPAWQDIVVKEVPHCTVITGADTRQESAYLGLRGFLSIPDIVVVHDAVRPFVSREIVMNNVQAAILHGAVDTCIPSADTLVYAPHLSAISSIPKREDYLRGQTPQTFLFDILMDAHESARSEGITNVSDDCQLVLRKGRPVHVVQGSEKNFKITTDFDLKIASIIT